MDTDCVFASAGMYPLRSINDRLVKIIDACYSNNGIFKEKSAVYSPYSSKSEELCSSNSPVSKPALVSQITRDSNEKKKSSQWFCVNIAVLFARFRFSFCSAPLEKHG